MKLDPNMPPELVAQVTRMHNRMNEWRAKNPKEQVLVLWRDDEGMVVIAPIRSAIRLGFVHTNDPGFEMIRAMCEPEKPEPLMSIVRIAMELEASNA